MYLIGKTDVARYQDLRVWADRGLIHIEDSRDNSYLTVPVRTMLQRLRAISEMLGKTRASRKGFIDEHLRATIQGALDMMLPICKKAQEQGMPTDPSAAGPLMRSRSKTIAFPTARSSM